MESAELPNPNDLLIVFIQRAINASLLQMQHRICQRNPEDDVPVAVLIVITSDEHDDPLPMTGYHVLLHRDKTCVSSIDSGMTKLVRNLVFAL
jgi:hypothetical protein